MDKKYTILIIDDKTENLHYLNTLLKEEDYLVRASTDPIFAINSSKLNPPHLILLDIKMPNLDGFEVCKLLKNEENLKNIPIIAINGIITYSLDTKKKQVLKFTFYKCNKQIMYLKNIWQTKMWIAE